MKLFPPPLNIDDTEGFTAENDLFSRKPIGEGMSNLLTKVTTPLTIAVDGQWGSGKTTFLKMWAGELRNQNVPVVYFDAFASDHNEDAFSAIAQALISLARKSEPQMSAATRSFVAASGGISRLLAKGAFKAALRVASQGIIDDELLQSWTKPIEEQASNVTDELVDNFLKEQEAKDRLLVEFREALVRLPTLLSQNRNPDAKAAPLIIIVDELDRCRPTFAVQVLESIKHFFSVERTHFVLGLHAAQLHSSIRAVYGAGIDAGLYLEKFIHLNVFLTGDRSAFRELDIVKYIGHWKREMEIPPSLMEDFEAAAQLIIHVAEHKDLPIRSVQRILSNVTLAITTAPRHWLRDPLLLAGLSIMKASFPEAYRRAKAGTLDAKEARTLLALNQTARHELGTYVSHARLLWDHCTGASVDPGLSQHWRLQYNIDAGRALPLLATHIVDFWGERAPVVK